MSGVVLENAGVNLDICTLIGIDCTALMLGSILEDALPDGEG
jgi:hypothetical protein